uniref:AlNc14C289G10207 protein n=1 Tax=Albugo laibachii Nc14 TaxID=890382 RepID=F0WV62_9STRA|nr:AlNc14C289G10207 [Albugo laibachii Nc14]|eukprot:CCA25301.1 AlNc14C289G10207 [Albugo laibachii Nc14]
MVLGTTQTDVNKRSIMTKCRRRRLHRKRLVRSFRKNRSHCNDYDSVDHSFLVLVVVMVSFWFLLYSRDLSQSKACHTVVKSYNFCDKCRERLVQLPLTTPK